VTGDDVYSRVALRVSSLLLQGKRAHTVVLGPGDKAALLAIKKVDEATDTLNLTAFTNSDNWTRIPGQPYAPHDSVPMTLHIEQGGQDGKPQVLAD
jgi:hypothetical protein